MVSSALLRLSAFSALFLAVLGCNPQNSPPDAKTYTKMDFKMEDVNLNARWTGPKADDPRDPIAPQVARGRAVIEQIRKDIDLFVDAVTGQYNLPQDMVSVKVDDNDELYNITLIPDVLGTSNLNAVICQLPVEGVTPYDVVAKGGIVSYCKLNERVAVPFTITGQFTSTMPAPQDMWDSLAKKVQEKLDAVNFVDFNSNDLTVEPSA